MNARDVNERRMRITSTVRPEVQCLERYHVPDASGFIKLDAMENPYPLPPALARAVAEAASRAEINRYPDASAGAARDALRRSLALPDGADVLLGNGSDELIQIIASTIARPDAGILAPDPSFVMYRRTALLAHAPFTAVGLRDDFSLDVCAMLDAIERTRPSLVFIANPNNPTGNAFARADIERIAQAAPGLVVVDEAYYAYADDSFLPRVLAFPNLVVLRTVSKIGMAGLRLGYLVGHPDWIGEFDKLRPPYNVGALGQAVLPVLLAHRDVFDAQASEIRAGRARLAEALARRGLRVFPSQANFVLVRVPDANAAFASLRDAKILVKNLDGSHPLLADCLRITVGTPGEIDALVGALDRHLKGGTR
jgi:histidinol-phosphate aminotransferase